MNDHGGELSLQHFPGRADDFHISAPAAAGSSRNLERRGRGAAVIGCELAGARGHLLER